MINLLPGGLVMINQMTMSARVFAAEGSAKHTVLAGRAQCPATANRRWRIYNFYPKVKVFFDGRSDFYAPSIRGEYLQLIGSGWRWEEIVDRYEFDAALLPLDWPLASTMKVHPDWAVVYDDGLAVYLERVK